GHADLPQLATVPLRHPLHIAEVEGFTRAHMDVGFRKLAQHTIGERIQGVVARTDLWNSERSVSVVTARPEFVMLGVRLPCGSLCSRCGQPYHEAAGEFLEQRIVE